MTSLETFRDYLLVLSREAEGQPSQWRNTTVPAFLSGWVSYLVTSHDSLQTVPGWGGLARFLHEARNHEFAYPSYGPSDLVDDEERVATKGDLVFYLIWLCLDHAADQKELAERASRGLWAAEGRWAHSGLSAWLETWAAWLEGAHMPTNPWRDRCEVEPVTWRSCANQLGAARVYE